MSDKIYFSNEMKILFLGFILFNLIIGCNLEDLKENPTTKSDYLVYVNEGDGYSISYPSDWTVLPSTSTQGYHGDEEISAVLVEKFQPLPAVTITMKNYNSPTLEDAVFWGESRIINLFEESNHVIDYDLSDVTYNEIDGKEFAERNYTYTDGEYTAIRKDAYIVESEKMFVLTFAAFPDEFDNQLDIFSTIINSFSTEINPWRN